MTGIDRRSLMKLAGAGAGLMLAGTARAQCQKVEQPAGSCPSHGQLATAAGHTAGEAEVKVFDPKYLCVVYVRFADDKKLKIRTAYVELVKPYDVAAIAQPILDKMRNDKKPNSVKDREDLEDFTFGSQTLIVFFIDNDPRNVGFDDRFKPENIVRFTGFLGSDPERGAQENHAFFNLKRLEFENPGSLRSRVAYQLEFWNTNVEGGEIQATADCPESHYIYSMNIHLKMAVRTSKQDVLWVPIILDPDTGNMGGRP